MTCHDDIVRHAIPPTQAVRHFLAREIPYRQREDLSWQLLSHWPTLPRIPDKQPANEREAVYSHLLHRPHPWGEQQLGADVRLRPQPMACGHFLETADSSPRHCIRSRP